MANPYVRTTGTQRKIEARAKVRYAHVSVQVGWAPDPDTGVMMPVRTPKHKGSTARRAIPKAQSKRDSWRARRQRCAA